jgi:hypothetical protein
MEWESGRAVRSSRLAPWHGALGPTAQDSHAKVPSNEFRDTVPMELTSCLFTSCIPDGQVSPDTGQHGVIGQAALQAAADSGWCRGEG